MATQDMERMLREAEQMGLSEDQEAELMKMLEMEEPQPQRRKRTPPPPPQAQPETERAPKRSRLKATNVRPTNPQLDDNPTTGGPATAESGDSAPVGRRRRKTEQEDKEFLERPPRKATRLEKNLQNAYYSVGLLASWFNTMDGEIIASQAEARAAEVARYASHHPEFKYWLEGALEKSDLMAMIAGHATLATALMLNHGMVPRDLAGVVGTSLKERIRARAERNARKAAETAAKVSGFPNSFKGYTPNPES